MNENTPPPSTTPSAEVVTSVSTPPTRSTKKSSGRRNRRGGKQTPVRAVVANSEEMWSNGIDWPVVVWLGVVHIGALAAPFYFTWQGLVIAVFLCWVTGSLGVCMGYHRLLTHGSFTTYRPVRWLLAIIGGLSGEGSALTWVANHRKHHVFSDKDGDPHSPRDGRWWSHMLWFMPNFGQKWQQTLTEKYAPDILKDPVMRVIHHMFLPSHFIIGAVLLAIGYFIWGLDVGVSMLIWGLFVRTVYVLHVTWCVNSASHIWGYRNYETDDDSRNNWWVGLLAFGEGWHNNHHAFQRMAKQGHRWWEIDITYWAILLMEKTGLAWNVVKDPQHGTKAVI